MLLGQTHAPRLEDVPRKEEPCELQPRDHLAGRSRTPRPQEGRQPEQPVAEGLSGLGTKPR